MTLAKVGLPPAWISVPLSRLPAASSCLALSLSAFTSALQLRLLVLRRASCPSPSRRASSPRRCSSFASFVSASASFAIAGDEPPRRRVAHPHEEVGEAEQVVLLPDVVRVAVALAHSSRSPRNACATCIAPLTPVALDALPVQVERLAARVDLQVRRLAPRSPPAATCTSSHPLLARRGPRGWSPGGCARRTRRRACSPPAGRGPTRRSGASRPPRVKPSGRRSRSGRRRSQNFVAHSAA